MYIIEFSESDRKRQNSREIAEEGLSEAVKRPAGKRNIARRGLQIDWINQIDQAFLPAPDACNMSELADRLGSISPSIY